MNIKNFGYDTEFEDRNESEFFNSGVLFGKFTDSVFSFKNGKYNSYMYHVMCKAYMSPTGNCQIYCISYFDRILAYDNWYEILCYIQYKMTKNILMIDIKYHLYDELLKKINKKDIISCQRYTSTNDSDMCIVLINTRKIQRDVNNYLNKKNWENVNYKKALLKYNKKQLDIEKDKLLKSINKINSKENTVDKIYNDLIKISND